LVRYDSSDHALSFDEIGCIIQDLADEVQGKRMG